MRKKTRLIYILYIVGILCSILLYVFLTNTNEQFEDSVQLEYRTESKVMVFTYATEMKDTLRVLLESLKGNNYSYRVLGYGETWRGFRNRVNTYLSGVSKYKEERGDDALVVMVDGYDCLCIKDSEKLYKSFINKVRKEIPVLYAAEVACLRNCNRNIKKWYTYHNIYGGEEGINKLIHEQDGVTISETPIFLNGGMVMGKARAVEQMYKGMMELNIEDDQICAAEYVANNPGKVDLDIEEHIFRNKLLERRVYLDDENGEDGPAFLHFPGSSTSDMKEMIELFRSYREIPK
jgi:hypothetical protein